MKTESDLLETLRLLPPEKRSEVFDFVEFLHQRNSRPQNSRPFGLCKGEFTVPEDFDEALPESILRDFES